MESGSLITRWFSTKRKSIIFGSNHSLKGESELRLCIDGTSIKQVKVTKLLGVRDAKSGYALYAAHRGAAPWGRQSDSEK